MKKPLKHQYFRYFSAAFLVYSLFILGLPAVGYAQTATANAAQTKTAVDIPAALAAIEKRLDERRKELGIPGVSLVIVKDGKVIYSKGLGYKNLEEKVAVTPDTQFAIGSATKAFTGLTVLMSQDDGKLSLDDSPKKALPYFKMYDPETDKNITIRDLLSHSSGLNRTDIAMITGKLNREELIRVAGMAKPTAKLREKWQYQNLMFTAAGEAVSKVQKTPWEKFVVERVLKPIGMTNSTLSMKQMAKTKDHSFGYNYNFDTKTATRLPFRDIDQVAPAGSINSSANDMAKWLQFILAEGVAGNKRLVSEASFAEWMKPQMKISPNGSVSYGLGWFLQEWNGKKVVQHGGNIDGFNSMVALLPEEELGFVLLTNVTSSSLGSEMMPVIWKNILNGPGEDNKIPADVADALAGKYLFAQANLEFEVKKQDGGLVVVVPGQPNYQLEPTGTREFKLGGAPDGFSVKFLPETGDVKEMFLRQPQGDITLSRVGAETAEAKPVSAELKELVGKYTSAEGAPVEIKEAAGNVSLNIPGQQPYILTEREKDSYALQPLPPTYYLNAGRDAEGKINAVTVVQPEGEFRFERSGAQSKPVTITAEELMQKVIEAQGGEENLRKITSRVSTFDIDMVHQGVKGYGTIYSRAPNSSATETTITALGKKIGETFEYFDGTKGGENYSFSPSSEFTGQRLENMRLGANLAGLLDREKLFKSITVAGIEKVGDEEAYAVDFEPHKATKYREFYSVETFLPLKREGVSISSTSSVQLPYSTVFSDYRNVEGTMVPFKVVNTSSGMGDVVITLKDVKTNVPVKDSIFAPRKLQ